MVKRGVEVRKRLKKESAFNIRVPCDALMNTVGRESLDVP